jgi:SAM-dependent methyltransferase
MATIARKLSALGLRFLKSPLQTVPDLLESLRMRVQRDSTFRLRRHVIDAASNCPSRMIDRAIDLWQPRSVLELGCGTGKVLDYLLTKGVLDVYGLEGSAEALKVAAHPELMRQVDLAKLVDLGRKFDLVYTFEVAEHIRPDSAEEFVRTCTRHADRVLMSAAQPGQGGLGHLNEQPPAYWIALFERRGFVMDEGGTRQLKDVHDLHWQNLLVLRRR